MDLQDRVALVTGSSRGIGKAVAHRLASSGARVLLNSVNNSSVCEEFARELNESGHEAFAIRGDVASASEAEMLVNESVSRFGKIDILVNNAGVVEDAPALGMTDEAWAKVLSVNLTGVFHMCRAAAKHMMFQRYGRIVNVSSFVARVGNKGQANYAASKGGLEAMTRTLAIELGPKGITVNAVAPGCIETEMSQNSVLGFKDKLLPRIPVKRIGKPEEVASLVHYLVQEEAGYITGEVIGVTGGLGLWVL